MIIDLHTHIVPDAFPAANGRGGSRWPSMDHFEPGRAKVMIAGENFRTVTDQCWSHARRMSDLEAEGADAQVVSPMPELLSYWFSPGDGLDMCRFLNEQIANLVQAAPGSFYGLGAVPLQEPDLAAKELAAIKASGLLGVELGSHVLGKSLGEGRFLSFFQEAEAREVAIFVHALHPTYTDRFPSTEQTINAIGFPMEGGLTIGSMITSGLLERCPNLRLAVSHGGGTFPFYLPRLENAWSRQWNGLPPKAGDPLSPLRQQLPQSPTSYARRLYYDSLLFDRRTIRYLIDLMGATQVTVGTDYPFFPREQPVGKTLRGVVSDDEWELVSHKNVLRFLGIDHG